MSRRSLYYQDPYVGLSDKSEGNETELIGKLDRTVPDIRMRLLDKRIKNKLTQLANITCMLYIRMR